MRGIAITSCIALLLPDVTAFWRMPCDNFNGLYRMDPIVSPGQLSEHAHNIHGSTGFGLNAKYSDLMAGCTTCRVAQDKSAYWTPALMFRYANGTVEAVPQIGGLLAYYLLLGRNIKAFPAGFQMLAGDGTRRNFTLPHPDPPKSLWTQRDLTQSALAQKSLGFNCLNYGRPAEPSLYRHELPEKSFIDATCNNGLRLEIAFPSCWNGQDLDSPDHKSHVAYSSLIFDGTCPSDYKVRVPTLFFETIFWTPKYRGVAGQYILSNNDQTGNGYHGDYMAGWDPAFLQRAIDKCRNPSGLIDDCSIFNLNYDAKEECKFTPPKEAARERCVGPRNGLCGGEPSSAAAPVEVQKPHQRQDSAKLMPAPALAPAPVPALPVEAAPAAPASSLAAPVALALPAAPVPSVAESPMPPAPPAPAAPKTSKKPNVKVVVEEVDVEETVTQYIKRAEPTPAPHAQSYDHPYDHPQVRHMPRHLPQHLARRHVHHRHHHHF